MGKERKNGRDGTVDARRALARVGLSLQEEDGPGQPPGLPQARTRSAPRAPGPRPGGTRLDDAISAFLTVVRSSGRAPATARFYQSALTRFLHWVEEVKPRATCADLDHELADGFLGHLRHDRVTPLRRPLSDRTVHHYVNVLKIFARWGTRGRRYWPASPLADYETPAFTEMDIVPYTHEELEALLAACGSATTYVGRRLLAMLLVTLDTGVRRGELRRLTLSMIDLTSGRVRLPATITKTRRPRTVHLQQASLSAVQSWLVARNALPGVSPDNGPLFCGLDGTMLSDGAMDGLALRLRARSGVTRFRWHLMRHTAGTESLRNGADSLDVQEALGHISSAMTRRYLHLTDDDRRARHARYSPVEVLLGAHEPRESRFRRSTASGRPR